MCLWMIRYLKFDFFNCIKIMYCKNTVCLMRSYWEKGQQIFYYFTSGDASMNTNTIIKASNSNDNNDQL